MISGYLIIVSACTSCLSHLVFIGLQFGNPSADTTVVTTLPKSLPSSFCPKRWIDRPLLSLCTRCSKGVVVVYLHDGDFDWETGVCASSFLFLFFFSFLFSFLVFLRLISSFHPSFWILRAGVVGWFGEGGRLSALIHKRQVCLLQLPACALANTRVKKSKIFLCLGGWCRHQGIVLSRTCAVCKRVCVL